MSTRIRMMLLGAAVLVTGVFGVSTAQASRSITSSQRVIGASGVLTLNNDRLICDVLIQISLNNTTIAKSAGSSIATATPGFIRNCSGPVAPAAPNNTGTILTTTTVRYDSFSGTLPRITAINISSTDAKFSVNTLAGVCLFEATTTNPLTGVSITSNGGSPNLATGAVFTNDFIDRRSGSILCPTTGAIRGTLGTVLAPVPTLTLA